MSETTARFALPLLVPGQAQKEFFHNEALVRIDAALCAAVEETGLTAPPAAPVEGQSWIVGAGAAGDWAGQDGALAGWTAAGWRFVAPVEGMRAWNRAGNYEMRWSGGAWTAGEAVCTSIVIGGMQVVGPRLAAVPSPSGGTTIDAEARAAINAIIATLMSHGLTE